MSALPYRTLRSVAVPSLQRCVRGPSFHARACALGAISNTAARASSSGATWRGDSTVPELAHPAPSRRDDSSLHAHVAARASSSGATWLGDSTVPGLAHPAPSQFPEPEGST